MGNIEMKYTDEEGNIIYFDESHISLNNFIKKYNEGNGNAYECCIHRTGGPAIIWADGDEWWYRHGMIHRVDGPAYNNDSPGKEGWALHGIRYKFKDWIEITPLSLGKKVELKLIYS